MVNMKTLIRIVFIIFIANGIDCLGGVCDNCCDCLKDKKEEDEIKGKKNNTGISLVNHNWYQSKKKDLVLRIFEKEKEKENDNVFTSTGNENKISIKLDEKDNSKIVYQDEAEDELELKDPLNLAGQKYALFKIKKQNEETEYLYCSDVGSSGNYRGIFVKKDHKDISVIAYDTKNVMNMNDMFRECHKLTKLDLKNFNTRNVEDMAWMFEGCSNLEKLEFEENFDTTKVENMSYMFSGCSRLTELDLQYFNTTNVTNMEYMFNRCSSLTKLDLEKFNTENVTDISGMFSGCSSLKELNLENFDTTKVTDMTYMFSGCSSLKKLDLEKFNTENVTEMPGMFYECRDLTVLKFGENFNTEKNPDIEDMFSGCSSFPNDIKNNLNDVKGIINFFKGENK